MADPESGGCLIKMMQTVRIHIEGIVQGVGFRPHVYRLAAKMGLSGWVNNGADGVRIEITGEEDAVRRFCRQLQASPPKQAFISAWDETPGETLHEGPFRIVESDSRQEKRVLLTPDYGMCADCEDELYDQDDRRYRYPFITCTLCGPRYSIITGLPYDRPLTTMHPFRMCPECQHEYDTPMDRRYYSQTNSCPSCAVRMTYTEGEKTLTGQEEILRHAVKRLRKGRILAVKGIGGFLLMCDATNPEAVQTLRQRKNRPFKPFAVLYPDEDAICGDVHMTAAERAGLYATEAPIVLLRKRHEQASGLAADDIAPGLNRIGVMRPYAPLLMLLTRDAGRPLVATSGNVSGSPIIFDNEQALKGLSALADGILMNDRDIVVPEDDSVIRFTRQGTRIILRRSRGLAPNYLGKALSSGVARLGLGADMKGTFALRHNDATYISQYLGDQDSYDAQQSYRHSLEHIAGILEFRPSELLTDLHPGYASTRLGRGIAGNQDIPLHSVQHHEAHFAAVLAENALQSAPETVLGVVWDGTGLGHDQQVWGGEFLLYENGAFRRYAHLKNFRHILGDKMAKEPRLSALSILRNTRHKEAVRRYFTDQEWSLYQGLLERSTLLSSSAGRVFDAAACLLDLRDRTTFEGEAASLLEAEAERSSRETRWDEKYGDHLLDPAWHLMQVLLRKNLGMSRQDNAFHFHYGLVRTIVYVAQQAGVQKVAFSGGVFQNGLLTELLESVPGLDLYFHQLLSPNDENISFGQLAHREITSKEVKPAVMDSLVVDH